MNVLIISQCNKRALPETRRILDQFAERKGDRTWQTAITQQGLATLRKMLRKNARKNTAVACHWIKKAGRTELLWIVGNMQAFNEEGSTPTNSTEQDILRAHDENLWHTLEEISLLAGIAGLFHDFGKANKLFQRKLRPTHKGKKAEPYRHEWVSLRLFQAFVNGRDDESWIRDMLQYDRSVEGKIFNTLLKDGNENYPANPFIGLPPIARIIAWLILTHHRLPKWPGKRDEEGSPRLKKIDSWLTNDLSASWNSPQCLNTEWMQSQRTGVWECRNGIPLRSKTWQAKARSLAKRVLKRSSLINGKKDWFADIFTMHLARLSLMLADHYYSAHAANPGWQDNKYNVYANTDRQTRELKQKLDEHVIGVGHNAVILANSLPVIRRTLPAITMHKGFKKRSTDPRYRWQDKAYDLACSIKERACAHGFFGVNMASTGCGKTFANGRIMYGLAGDKPGCRFSVALGLRTLTLQTGDALRNRLGLEDDDLAVLIGSQAVQQLHEVNKECENFSGSESDEELISEYQYVRYEGALDNGRLGEWLQRSPRLHRLVSAPILVSTIDHLMPATEGERGGKQIAPMLRLLTADLVLDEPDDFDLADLPALTRLVHWAGMLGARTLLSSATLPPALIEALFEAYLVGRQAFQLTCGEPGRPLNVCCAWFDEYRIAQGNYTNRLEYATAHEHFVKNRVDRLREGQPVRKARLLTVNSEKPDAESAVEALSMAAQNGMLELHAAHGLNHPETGRRISFGLVRMANINPMVAVAKRLLNEPAPADFRIHYCIYHSQHPLAIRSAIEEQLDSVLKRHDPKAIWQHESILGAIARYPENNHLFVVLATPVAEVGRDHDYDWAIAEPSSIRSLIQLAGRVQRHRNTIAEKPNLLVLSHNFRGLRGKPVAFCNPGYESPEFPLGSHDLHDLIEEEQYANVTASPRIMASKRLEANGNLAALEHAHLGAVLFGDEQMSIKKCAALWWRSRAHWCFELQRRMPFRQSIPESDYILYYEDEGQTASFHKFDEQGELKQCDLDFKRIGLVTAKGGSLWGEFDIELITAKLAEKFDLELAQACKRFGGLRLRQTDHQWLYHPALGVHGEL